MATTSGRPVLGFRRSSTTFNFNFNFHFPSCFAHRRPTTTSTNIPRPSIASTSSRPHLISSTRSSAAADRSPVRKRTCACSPTSHPGSFRCALHRSTNKKPDTTITTGGGSSSKKGAQGGDRRTSDRLDVRRTALANSLLRMGPVEAKWARQSLQRWSSSSSSHDHQITIGAAFHPRSTRLSFMAID